MKLLLDGITERAFCVRRHCKQSRKRFAKEIPVPIGIPPPKLWFALIAFSLVMDGHSAFAQSTQFVGECDIDKSLLRAVTGVKNDGLRNVFKLAFDASSESI